jgi:hypothetical protein
MNDKNEFVERAVINELKNIVEDLENGDVAYTEEPEAEFTGESFSNIYGITLSYISQTTGRERTIEIY